MKLAEYHKTVKASKPSKYRAKRCVVDGITFASKREARGYCDLLTDPDVTDIELQVRFDLHAVNGQKITSYVADYVYRRNGARIVADAKGVLTPLYRLKRKWMKAEYGIEIVEV